MAIVEVKVPQLSESVAEATLLQWKKKVGDSVAVDEILIEVETDKVVMEVPAPSAGVLIELVQADGATVAAEQLIARIDTEGKVGAAAPAPGAAAATVAAVPVAADRFTARDRGSGVDRLSVMVARCRLRDRSGRGGRGADRTGRCGRNLRRRHPPGGGDVGFVDLTLAGGFLSRRPIPA